MGKGEKSPTHIHAQKKAKGKVCDIIGGLYLRGDMEQQPAQLTA